MQAAVLFLTSLLICRLSIYPKATHSPSDRSNQRWCASGVITSV
jgi:hypothetical protein